MMNELLNANEKLPFKPMLGETLVLTNDEGYTIYLEQVSVRPSVTRVLLTSFYNKLRLEGQFSVS